MNAILENMKTQTFTHHDIEWAAQEVERQGEGPMHVAYMLKGLSYARLFGQDTPISDMNIINMNIFVRGGEGGGFRQTNVYFTNTVKEAADWQDIDRLMGIITDIQSDLTTDEFVKGFLDIHPFVDGNGRVASLLYNIKNGSIKEPVLLPNYYGE